MSDVIMFTYNPLVYIQIKYEYITDIIKDKRIWASC